MNTFQKQPQTQRKALQKALQSPLIGKHGKRRTTLLKEAVYKELQQKILEKVDVLFDAQLRLALDGKDGKPDARAIDSLLNRVFGRPAQEVTVHVPHAIEVDPEEAEKVNEVLARFLHTKK